MIKGKNLSYRYPNADFALSNIDLTVSSGKILGLVGENGAGKTTLLNLLTGFLKADSGEILFQDKTLSRTNLIQDISYLPVDFTLYDYLTLFENLTFVVRMRHLSITSPALEQILSDYQLLDRRDSKLATLSTGMKQRFFFLVATLHQPKLLILDEPFTGLDPKQILKFQQAIRDYAQKGHAVVFSSHVLDFVATLCDQVLVMNDGKIIKIIDKIESNICREDIEAYFV